MALLLLELNSDAPLEGPLLAWTSTGLMLIPAAGDVMWLQPRRKLFKGWASWELHYQQRAKRLSEQRCHFPVIRTEPLLSNGVTGPLWEKLKDGGNDQMRIVPWLFAICTSSSSSSSSGLGAEERKTSWKPPFTLRRNSPRLFACRGITAWCNEENETLIWNENKLSNSGNVK